ncbi:hypothetical protein JFT33_18735 [Pseudomonas carnis]|uniref:hypothetical protein n=1 Tax=Pseudomonas carnis TaxID=2487355 RepID=UPI000FD9BA63|nr:hypothetical protein [Pseudomonas carnis]MBJ2208626.1 hypothetical protein [Pseudomonas carnis]
MKKLEIPEGLKIASIWLVWAFVAVGVVGWSLFVVLRAFDVTQDAAAWVQAFGSILAIVGALSVSRKQVQAQSDVASAQIQHQMNMVEQAARDKAEAFFAVVDYAATSCVAICNMARQKMPVEIMGMQWEAHLKEVSQASLMALRRVPVHELGSYELVVGYSTVLASYINFISETERTISGDRQYHSPESSDLYAGMIQHNAMLQAGFEVFKMAHALKFGGLPEGTEQPVQKEEGERTVSEGDTVVVSG